MKTVTNIIYTAVNKNLLLIISLLVASSLHAVPLTWRFTGTAGPNSTYQGRSIQGSSVDLKIFLDTTLQGTPVTGTGTEVNFLPRLNQKFLGQVSISGVGVLPLHFNKVQNFG